MIKYLLPIGILLFVGQCMEDNFKRSAHGDPVYGVPGTHYETLHDRVLGDHSPMECSAAGCRFIQ